MLLELTQDFLDIIWATISLRDTLSLIAFRSSLLLIDCLSQGVSKPLGFKYTTIEISDTIIKAVILKEMNLISFAWFWFYTLASKKYSEMLNKKTFTMWKLTEYKTGKLRG